MTATPSNHPLTFLKLQTAKLIGYDETNKIDVTSVATYVEEKLGTEKIIEIIEKKESEKDIQKKLLPAIHEALKPMYKDEFEKLMPSTCVQPRSDQPEDLDESMTDHEDAVFLDDMTGCEVVGDAGFYLNHEWKVTLKAEVTPDKLKLKISELKAAEVAAGISEKCRTDITLCLEKRVRGQWLIWAVFATLELKLLRSSKAHDTIKEALFDKHGNAIHQALAYLYAMEVPSKLERCGIDKDVYSMVLFCDARPRSYEFGITIPQIGNEFNLVDVNSGPSQPRLADLESCAAAVLQVFAYGLDNAFQYFVSLKENKQTNAVPVIGRNPTDWNLEYWLSPINRSLANKGRSGHIHQGCLFKTHGSSVTVLKEKLGVGRAQMILVEDGVFKDDDIIIKIRSPFISSISQTSVWHYKSLVSTEMKELLQRSLYQIWKVGNTHWFLMPEITDKAPTSKDLQDHWKEYWETISVLACHSSDEFVYLDLRPRLDNIRFKQDRDGTIRCVLMDLDSFGEVQFGGDGRYPRCKTPSVYTLCQAVAGVWGVHAKVKESRLKNDLWFQQNDQYKKFETFCPTELHFLLKIGQKKSKVDVKDVGLLVKTTADILAIKLRLSDESKFFPEEQSQPSTFVKSVNNPSV